MAKFSFPCWWIILQTATRENVFQKIIEQSLYLKICIYLYLYLQEILFKNLHISKVKDFNLD